MQTNTKDIYWLAGILEGEGSFSCSSRKNGNFYPHIQINMRDRDVVERAHSILAPQSSVRTYADRRENRKPFWFETRLTGKRAVGWMMTLYPLMGQRRQARIRELLETWRTAGAT